MKERLKRLLSVIRRPSRHYSLGFLTLGGFIMGIIFWGGFNTALEAGNTETFCIGCHEMRDNVYSELQGTIHFTNRSGVRAECADCHVPHDWTNKIARKMQASKELWGKIFGTINTPEKFEAKRLELAQHEWARLKANDSLECRNCHGFDYMDFTRQSSRAMQQHSTALASGEKTCIDCHKGIAHRLPDMSGVEGWE
jgi:cytochrome c-type protein NapC